MKPFSHQGKEVGVGTFGKRLKEERIRRGFGVRQFGDMVGCAHSQITGFENRGVMPRLDTLVSLATVLDCSIDWLVGLED